MLPDSPIKWGPDSSNSTVRSFNPSPASIDSIEHTEHTKHTPHPRRPNVPETHDASSRRWNQPFRAVARGCRSVLPNIRTLVTKHFKPTPQVQQPAASASMTHPNEISTSPTSESTREAGPPKPKLASRVSISSLEHPRDQEQSMFVARAPIQLYNGPGDLQDEKRWGIVLYDSGCEYDLISTAYMAKRGNSDEAACKRTFAMSITGEHYEYSGTVRIRWYDPRFKKFRYMESLCRIVQSDFFDVIIGSKTMEKERLYVPNPVLIGPTIPLPPNVDSSHAEMVRRAQAAKLKREQELKAQAEEESRLEQA